ncbi:DEKNAAC101427 [Brettanomyces naardenensis]|uniref:DEKNAAC101427 n=1 Tax=Brettanomyces naardenensis TaxID=13370 RepID=A0A448YHY9_BRENA|nr:DEKNAAC101427 [Brettanomyces naardenensis]
MFDPDKLTYLDKSVDRRVCFITGGNSGLGFFTVLHLYLHGYIVYIAGRSKQRVDSAIRQLKDEALVRRAKETPEVLQFRHLGELKFIELDLSKLRSVEHAVKQFKTREKHLNLLILNAGIMAVPYSVTKDGFEIQLQINYVSHFLIADRLIGMMDTSDDVRDPRIIYLSSVGHRFADFHFNLSWEFNHMPNIVFTWFRYGMAKTAGIHMVKSLAKRHPKVLCVAVHPGFVMNTNLFSHFTRLPFFGFLFWVLFQLFGSFFGVTNEEGSYSTLRCLEEDLSTEKDNGKYFATFGVEQKPSSVATNENYADESWAWTVSELSRRGYETDRTS